MHASAPACVLGSLHMQHHNSAALWPITDLVTLPKSVTLHPVAGSCSVAVKILRDATSKDLQTLVAAWVEAQRGSIQQVCSSPSRHAKQPLTLANYHSIESSRYIMHGKSDCYVALKLQVT